jgi:citrate lyase subunit gamma (acyl carrier protein)
MKIIKTGVAGTMESNDIMITIEPKSEGGIVLNLSSSVMQQFGRQIEEVVRNTLGELDVADASVEAVDKGALDCTVRARVNAAAYRAADNENYSWGAK